MEAELSDSGEVPQLALVAGLLATAGLSPPADEIERLAGLYPGLRAAADRFHAVDAGDEVTAAVFRADPD